jgi:ubiquitin C-terminal hydrolase
MRSAFVVFVAAVHVASAAYLGLRNQGNTCYMNSLLQTLHHIPEFREAIYSIPTEVDGNGSRVVDNLVPLELQRVFYELQHAESVGKAEVGTEGLTRSFGWGRREVNEQQDVQEFSRMLCDVVQSTMQSMGVPDAVSELFEGRTASLTRCTHANFEKEKEERFYDLQLQVQGCRDVHSSLRQFVREERLDGDNKWNTQDERHGKQDARRSTRFRRLPPVLQLHLKRFECVPDFNACRACPTEHPQRLPFHAHLGRPRASHFDHASSPDEPPFGLVPGGCQSYRVWRFLVSTLLTSCCFLLPARLPLAACSPGMT